MSGVHAPFSSPNIFEGYLLPEYFTMTEPMNPCLGIKVTQQSLPTISREWIFLSPKVP